MIRKVGSDARNGQIETGIGGRRVSDIERPVPLPIRRRIASGGTAISNAFVYG